MCGEMCWVVGTEAVVKPVVVEESSNGNAPLRQTLKVIGRPSVKNIKAKELLRCYPGH